MQKSIKPIHFFYVGIGLTFLLNSLGMGSEILHDGPRKRHHAFYFSGAKFAGLEQTLHGVETIGYLTDKDLSIKKNAAQFAQAQYILVPVILDLNNSTHKFLLLDYSTEAKAFEKIREINAVPLKKNQYGIILAQNPSVSNPNKP